MLIEFLSIHKILMKLWTIFADHKLYPYLHSGLFHPYKLDESIIKYRCGWCNFSFLFHSELKFLSASSVNPDQTSSLIWFASDLVLHCLSMSPLWDARYKRVKIVEKPCLDFSPLDCSSFSFVRDTKQTAELLKTIIHHLKLGNYPDIRLTIHLRFPVVL